MSGNKSIIKIRCNGDGRLIKDYRIWLNDTEITNIVRGFNINVGVGKATVTTIDFVVSLDIPEEIIGTESE